MKRFTWRLTQLLIVPVLLVLGALTMLPAVPTLAAGSGAWTLIGSLHVGRADSTVTLLTTGQVLAAAGESSSSFLTSAELYNPASGTWTSTGSLRATRDQHTATLLSNGQVVVAGGQNGTIFIASAELYTP